jgi:hypothetical protein
MECQASIASGLAGGAYRVVASRWRRVDPGACAYSRPQGEAAVRMQVNSGMWSLDGRDSHRRMHYNAQRHSPHRGVSGAALGTPRP